MGMFKQEFNVSRSTSRTKQIIKNITPNDRGKKEWNPILIQQYPLKSQRILKIQSNFVKQSPNYIQLKTIPEKNIIEDI